MLDFEKLHNAIRDINHITLTTARDLKITRNYRNRLRFSPKTISSFRDLIRIEIWESARIKRKNQKTIPTFKTRIQ